MIDPRLKEIDTALYRCAAKALIVHDHKLLLVNEEDDDWWNMPGGGIDYGEDTHQALIRELHEEILLDEKDITIVGTPLFISTDGLVDNVPRLNIYYRVQVDPTLVKAGPDVAQFKWYSAEELKNLYLSPSIENHVPELLSHLV